MSWLFDEKEDGELVPLEAQVVETEERDPLAIMREAQAELMSESLEVLNAVMKFAEVGEGETEPPDEWVKQLGYRRAKKALVVAKAAQLPGKEAPAALKLASDVFLGLTKAAAMEKSGSKHLNIQVVQVETKQVEYDAIEVGRDVKRLKR